MIHKRVKCDEEGGVQYGYDDEDCSEESRANDTSAAYPLNDCEFYPNAPQPTYFTMGQCYQDGVLAESSLCDNNDTSSNL